MPQKGFGFGSIDDLLPQKEHPIAQKHAQEVETQVHSRTDDAKQRVGERMEELALEQQEADTRTKAQVYSMPYIQLVDFPIGPDVIALLPESMAREYKVIVFFNEDSNMRIGVVDPNIPQIQQVLHTLQKEHVNTEIKMYLISQHSFDIAVKLYKSVVHIHAVEYGIHITSDDLASYQKILKNYSDLEKQLEHVNMTTAFGMIISMALAAHSSDVHIEARRDAAVIRFRIDGVLTDIATLSVERLPSLVSRVKAIAEIKMNITTIPQDGRISIDIGNNDTLDIRVSTLPSAFGESIVMRLLKSESVGLSFSDLGMRKTIYEKLQEQIYKPNGMIITTGPTGSGKTTTLYAILNTLNSPENKIITLENPIEYKLEGIVQSQIDESRMYTFDEGLRSILRQDPDIVMVGEIRDEETAKTAVDAALTGHLLLSTIHTNDAAGAVPRLLSMGIQGIYLAPALNAVIGQRLVRLLCVDCKKEYIPEPALLQKAIEWIDRIPENSGERVEKKESIVWYQAVGCEKCDMTGYKGRIGVYEVFTMSSEIEQQIISQKVSEYQMKEILYRAGMLTMGQDGILKAAEGMTTLDEVFRVTKE